LNRFLQFQHIFDFYRQNLFAKNKHILCYVGSTDKEDEDVEEHDSEASLCF